MSSRKNKKDQAMENMEIYLPEKKEKINLNFYANSIPAGFPSPADDFLEKQLDLNDYLIRNKAATFLVKVEGRSMENAGIYDGDVLVIDRSVEPVSGKVVLGVLNGEFTVKRISMQGSKVLLIPENENFQPIELTEEMDFKIWGVATFSLHRL